MKTSIYLKISLLLLAMLLFFSLAGSQGLQAQDYDDEMDELEQGFYTMKNIETGETVMRTARILFPGDEYINRDNDFYRVTNIEGDIAWAQHIEKITLRETPPDEWLSGALERMGYMEQSQQEETTPPKIGVYHSHGAESYVPSDGTDSIPEGGGILEVGSTFSDAMEENGLDVMHTDETHVPHDAGAYHRSRRTAEELLKEGADVLFDVHRDAVPPQEYLAVVDSQERVQLQFVIGRQNQNIDVNRLFAESLKRVTDNLYPNLVKGILIARGNYNQDIIPLSLLIEVGTHENTREGAEESMTLFADAVSTYFVGPQGRQAQEQAGGTALRSILWLVLIALLVLGVYLLISTENMEELRAKVRHFFSREFAELGKRKEGGDEERNDEGRGE